MTSVRTYITQGPVPNLEWFDNPVEGLALVSKLHTAKLQKLSDRRRRLVVVLWFLWSQKRIEGNIHPVPMLSPFLSFWSAFVTFVWPTCATSRAIFGLHLYVLMWQRSSKSDISVSGLCGWQKLLQLRLKKVWLNDTQRVWIQHPEGTASQKLISTKVSGHILQHGEKVLCLVLVLSCGLVRLSCQKSRIFPVQKTHHLWPNLGL